MEANRTHVGLAPLAVMGAAMGVVAALVCVAAFWMAGLDVNGGVVGGIAGALAGATTALLGAQDRIR